MQKTKSLLTKCLAFLFIVCCVVAATVGLVACDDSAALTIKSITNNGSKLVITYSDGSTAEVGYTDSSSSGSTTVTTCTHEHTTEEKVDTAADTTCHITYKVKCTDCGTVVDVKAVSAHDWNENKEILVKRVYCSDRAHYVYQCKNCDETKFVRYNDAFAEGIDVAWEDDGRENEGCTDLTDEVSYLLDDDGKMVNSNDSNVFACECTRVTAKVCKTCGKEVRLSTVNPVEHDFGVWSIAKVPGASQEDGKGSVKHTCTVCNKTESQNIDSLYVADENGADTVKVKDCYKLVKGASTGKSCSEEGRKDKYTFEIDGQTLDFTVEVKESHYIVVNDKKINIESGRVYDYVEGVFFTTNGAEIKCGSEGYSANYQCKECDGYYTALVKKTSHAEYKSTDVVEDKTDATCEDASKFKYRCSLCGEWVDAPADKVDPAIGHKLVSDTSRGTDGFEEKDGKRYVYIKCANTGCEKVFAPIELKDGKYETETVSATCDTAGGTKYFNIQINEKGDILKDSKNDPVEFTVSSGKPNGHKDGIVSGSKYDYDELVAKGIKVIISDNSGDKFFNCKNYDGSSDEKYRDASYLCVDCNKYIGFFIKKSHTPKEGSETAVTWKDNMAPTCAHGATQIIDCVAEGCGNAEVLVPALGHELQYKVTKNTDGKYMITGVICARTGCSTVDFSGVEDILAIDGTVEVTNCDPSCKDKTTGTVGDKTIDIAKLEDQHVLNGKIVSKGSKDSPVDFVEGMVENYLGQTIKCYIPADVNENGNTIYQCEKCDGYFNAFAVKPHNIETETITAATCTTSGSQKEKCKNTGCTYEESAVDVPASGHKVTGFTYTVVENAVKITITCGRCNKVLDDTLDISVIGWYKDESGHIIIDTDTVTAAGFTCTVAGEGASCKDSATYTFTLTGDKYTVSGEGATSTTYDFSGKKLTFDLTLKASHVATDDTSRRIPWVDENGVKHWVVLCEGCDQIVPYTGD